jgi:hypothetical protein
MATASCTSPDSSPATRAAIPCTSPPTGRGRARSSRRSNGSKRSPRAADRPASTDFDHAHVPADRRCAKSTTNSSQGPTIATRPLTPRSPNSLTVARERSAGRAGSYTTVTDESRLAPAGLGRARIPVGGTLSFLAVMDVHDPQHGLFGGSNRGCQTTRSTRCAPSAINAFVARLREAGYLVAAA